MFLLICIKLYNTLWRKSLQISGKYNFILNLNSIQSKPLEEAVMMLRPVRHSNKEYYVFYLF